MILAGKGDSGDAGVVVESLLSVGRKGLDETGDGSRGGELREASGEVGAVVGDFRNRIDLLNGALGKAGVRGGVPGVGFHLFEQSVVVLGGGVRFVGLHAQGNDAGSELVPGGRTIDDGLNFREKLDTGDARELTLSFADDARDFRGDYVF